MSLQDFRDGTVFTPRRKRSWPVNWAVFWTGQVWWLMETAHYGWNFAPASDAEMICDGIFVLIMALAWRPAKNNGEGGRNG
jgi:hypothetical protein